MIRKLFVATLVIAVMVLAVPSGVGAAPLPNDITGMSVTFDRVVTEGGQTFNVFDTAVTFTHRGPVHVSVHALDQSATVVATENADYGGRGGEVYADELWVEQGTAVTYGALLGRHHGATFVVLDTYTLAA